MIQNLLVHPVVPTIFMFHVFVPEWILARKQNNLTLFLSCLVVFIFQVFFSCCFNSKSELLNLKIDWLNWQFGLFMRLFRAYFCPLCMYNMVMCYVHFLTLELLRLLNSGKEVIKTMLQPPAFLVNKAKQQHNQTLGYLTYSAYFPLVFFHKDILWRFSM